MHKFPIYMYEPTYSSQTLCVLLFISSTFQYPPPPPNYHIRCVFWDRLVSNTVIALNPSAPKNFYYHLYIKLCKMHSFSNVLLFYIFAFAFLYDNNPMFTYVHVYLLYSRGQISHSREKDRSSPPSPPHPKGPMAQRNNSSANNAPAPSRD